MDLNRQKIILGLSIAVAIETGIGSGTVSLTNAVPADWVPIVKTWMNLLAFVGSTIVAALTGGSIASAPAKVAQVALAVAIFSILAMGGASAQQTGVGKVLQGIAQKNDANRVGGPFAASPFVSADGALTGDPVADLHAAIIKGGAKLIMHLKQSYALAESKNANGVVDNTSATCTKALVPIVDLVVNGPKAGTLDPADPMTLTPDEVALAANTSEPEGVIVQVEKLRILRLSLTSPALNDACGALVQDEVKNAQNLVGKITSLITGAGLAGITGGLVP